MAVRLKIGFNPLKEVSTVSYICGNCQKHCNSKSKKCQYCGATLTNTYTVIDDNVISDINHLKNK